MKTVFKLFKIRFWLIVIFTFIIIVMNLACSVTQNNLHKQKAKIIGRGGKVAYLAVGDSTCVGLGARNQGGYVDRLASKIKESNDQLKLFKFCSVGATTDDVLKTQMKGIPEERPMLVTISIGINDFMQGVKVSKFASNYEEIVLKLKQENVFIVTTNLPDIGTAPAGKTYSTRENIENLDAFNNAIKEIGERHGLPVVDLNRFRTEILSGNTNHFSADGFHPSGAGYKIWADALWIEAKEAFF